MNRTFQSLVAFFALAALIFVAASCADTKGETKTIPAATDAVPVKVVKLTKSSAVTTILASGQLTTDDETTLAFKIGGIVKAIYVKEGDPIKKGQLLAILDQTEINATVAQAKHSFEKAQRDFQRATNLYRDSVGTLEQLQNTQTTLAVAREQLATAQFNRSHSEIRATGNGFVLQKFVNPGQVVGAGERVLVSNGASNGNWILKIGVSDKQWASLTINEKATVKIDALPGKAFDAFVSRKSETVDPQTGTFSVELKLQAKGQKLATGMFGSASIQSTQSNTYWSVPYEAVLDASGNEGFVFITNDGKTAHKQPVTVASFNGKSIELSQGLEQAKLLIVSGSAYLSDRSPIHIVK